MSNEIPTPITDAFIKSVYDRPTGISAAARTAQFARRLERELTLAQEAKWELVEAIKLALFVGQIVGMSNTNLSAMVTKHGEKV
jgi:hypothetical protein